MTCTGECARCGKMKSLMGVAGNPVCLNFYCYDCARQIGEERFRKLKKEIQEKLSASDSGLLDKLEELLELHSWLTKRKTKTNNFIDQLIIR